MRKTYTPNELRELVRHRLGAFYQDESAAALSYAADVIEAAQKVIDERAADRPESVTDEARDAPRLLFVARAVDGWGDVDIHDEAASSACANGREEPNDDDYLTAVRIALDAAIASTSSAGVEA